MIRGDTDLSKFLTQKRLQGFLAICPYGHPLNKSKTNRDNRLCCNICWKNFARNTDIHSCKECEVKKDATRKIGWNVCPECFDSGKSCSIPDGTNFKRQKWCQKTFNHKLVTFRTPKAVDCDLCLRYLPTNTFLKGCQCKEAPALPPMPLMERLRMLTLYPNGIDATIPSRSCERFSRFLRFKVCARCYYNGLQFAGGYRVGDVCYIIAPWPDLSYPSGWSPLRYGMIGTVVFPMDHGPDADAKTVGIRVKFDHDPSTTVWDFTPDQIRERLSDKQPNTKLLDLSGDNDTR